MTKNDLPKRWQIKLKEYLQSKNSPYQNLGAEDFPSNTAIQLLFEDESFTEFRYAFVLEALELNEVGVFTEHCGYHIFALSGVEITSIDLDSH